MILFLLTSLVFLIPEIHLVAKPTDRVEDYYEIPSVAESEDELYFPSPDHTDLEEKLSDFVLETKQIKIPGFPDAFNPSIVRWGNSILMSFRTYEPKTLATNKIGLVWLNENCDPIGPPQILKISNPDPFCVSKQQDPRLISVGDRLFVAYNNVLKCVPDKEIRRMLLAEVFFDGAHFFTGPSDCFVNFEGKRDDRSEKNWVPFTYQGEILLSYGIIPHRVFRPLYGESECETVASTLSSVKWDWGVLRGGTPALMEGDEFLAFFHSSKSMTTTQSKGKSIPHYFMGAYTFSPHPPFAITRMSARPIIGKNFYNGPAYKTWKPLKVVFPGGFVSDDHHIWIAYGRQDHEIWMTKLSKKGLFKSLIPVTQK
jgi:predicted GH43/DUF377 family glycosyl hydrolase